MTIFVSKYRVEHHFPWLHSHLLTECLRWGSLVNRVWDRDVSCRKITEERSCEHLWESEGRSIGHREGLNCNGVTTKVSYNHKGNSGAGMALQGCPQLRPDLCIPTSTNHWMKAVLREGAHFWMQEPRAITEEGHLRKVLELLQTFFANGGRRHCMISFFFFFSD